MAWRKMPCQKESQAHLVVLGLWRKEVLEEPWMRLRVVAAHHIKKKTRVYGLTTYGKLARALFHGEERPCLL